MNKLTTTTAIGALTCLALAASPRAAHSEARASQTATAVVVDYPWAFQSGSKPAIKTAIDSLDGMIAKAGWKPLSRSVARSAWKSGKFTTTPFGQEPSIDNLEAFGKSVNANEVVFGEISWDTDRTWISSAAKTVSTATVNAYVLDVATGKLIFQKKGVIGASDEKDKDLSFTADVYSSQLVEAPIAGPKTPHEQRAAQIAIGRAFHDWVKPS